MTWKQGEPMDVPNLENYESQKTLLISQISDLQAQVTQLTEKREQILSGNNELLKADRENIEALHKEADKYKADHIYLLDENKARSEALDQECQLLANDRSAYEAEKAQNLKEVENRHSAITDREFEAERKLLEASAILDAANDKLEFNSNLVKEHLAKVSVFQEQKDAHQIDKEQVEAKHAKALELNKASEQMIALANEAKAEAEKKEAEAKASLEEANKKSIEASQMLEQVKSEQEKLQNMIIESKKANLDACLAVENARITIANANQKLAELNDLKKALAEQEK